MPKPTILLLKEKVDRRSTGRFMDMEVTFLSQPPAGLRPEILHIQELPAAEKVPFYIDGQ
ncbi:MAG: hypothetical protein JZU50_14030 [Desulfobulbaceae bacterium]|nr:hypothetical protein [Desulfobulbaceae bacterium]